MSRDKNSVGGDAFDGFFFAVIVKIIYADAALPMLLFSVASQHFSESASSVMILFVLKLFMFPPSDQILPSVRISSPKNALKNWMKKRLSPEHPDRRVNNMTIFRTLCLQLEPQTSNIHDVNFKLHEWKIRSLRQR